MKKEIQTYYALKPFIPRSLQIWLRRKIIKRRLRKLEVNQAWPILESAKIAPNGWLGWPGDSKFALVLTHDVEHPKGLERCQRLAEIERGLGFCSSYNFVPERYSVPDEIRSWLSLNGFEVGVHGLKHDGKLFSSEKIFMERAAVINQYLEQWRSVGFRSPAMHRNLDWIGRLNVEYDLSTFDTDPFEPQSDGVGTVFPFMVPRKNGSEPYVEMPYTLPQDHMLFVIMNSPSIDIWKRKVDWIAKHGGMVLLNVHPDYICFEGSPKLEEYSVDHYIDLLNYIKSRYSGRYWNALPRNVAEYWRMTEDMRVQHRNANGCGQSYPDSVIQGALETDGASLSQISASI